MGDAGITRDPLQDDLAVQDLELVYGRRVGGHLAVPLRDNQVLNFQTNREDPGR